MALILYVATILINTILSLKYNIKRYCHGFAQLQMQFICLKRYVFLLDLRLSYV